MSGRDLEPLGPDLLSHLRRAKAIPELSEERKRLLFAGVAARIVPSGGGGGAQGTDGQAPFPTKGLVGAKALVGLALTFAMGVASGIVLDRAIGGGPVAPSAQSVRVSPPAPPAVEPAPTGTTVATAPQPSAATSVVSAAPVKREALADTAASARGLAAERALLDVARADLARGEAGEALSATDRHAREYPRGALVEEREALAIKALVALGRTNEARTRAREFERRFPNGLLLYSVKMAVGDGP
jgi:hypothetical protein